MKIFNILLASKAVFGAEKCHLPVSVSIQNFLLCTISNFATFGPSTLELWDGPLFGIVNLLLRPYTLSLWDRPVYFKKDFLLLWSGMLTFVDRPFYGFKTVQFNRWTFILSRLNCLFYFWFNIQFEPLVPFILADLPL